MMKIGSEDLRSQMAQCTGTQQYHKLSLMPLLATDGVAMVAQKAGAFWLVDAIASYQGERKVKELAIQFWTLEVKDKKAVLYCQEDKDFPHIVEQNIGYTDFPDGEWMFYVQNKVIMLPNEY